MRYNFLIMLENAEIIRHMFAVFFCEFGNWFGCCEGVVPCACFTCRKVSVSSYHHHVLSRKPAKVLY